MFCFKGLSVSPVAQQHERSFSLLIQDCIHHLCPHLVVVYLRVLYWGPFSLFLLPMGSSFKKHNITFHYFVDDLQKLHSTRAHNLWKDHHASVQATVNCQICTIMFGNKLSQSMNKNKTVIILFGKPSHQLVMTVSFVPQPLTEFSKNKRQCLSIFELKRSCCNECSCKMCSKQT